MDSMRTHPPTRLCQTPLKGAAVAVLAWRFQTGFRGANEGDLVREGFKSVGSIPTTMARIARPLSEEESALLETGASLFDDGKFWHAHEAWEDLWNDLKRRDASPHEILLVQGLIQTAALLLHHQRKTPVAWKNNGRNCNQNRRLGHRLGIQHRSAS